VADLTPCQLAVLRACPDPPGARFASTTVEEARAIDALAALGLMRALPYSLRSHETHVWQRTPAGKEVADG